MSKENKIIDTKLYDNLRELLSINNTILLENKSNENKPNWDNIACCSYLNVMLDRLKNALYYLNDCENIINKNFNISYIDEYQFYSFFMACNTIKEIINQTLNLLSQNKNYNYERVDNKTYFFKDDWNTFSQGNKLRDDYDDEKFFNYIRSLILVHSINTTDNLPFYDTKTQVKNYNEGHSCGDISLNNGVVYLNVWSNKSGFFKGSFSINSLLDYVKSKYGKINDIIDLINSKLAHK